MTLAYHLTCGERADMSLKESTQDVYELQEDDPLAVEETLRFLYTSEYPADTKLAARRDIPAWEKHLGVMIVADKYGISELEDAAFAFCKDHLKKLHEDERLDLRQVIDRSGGYPDMSGKFNGLIASMADTDGDTFMIFYGDTGFRQWLDHHSPKTDWLIEKHFNALLSLPTFREKLGRDGFTALCHLDRMKNEFNELKKKHDALKTENGRLKKQKRERNNRPSEPSW